MLLVWPAPVKRWEASRQWWGKTGSAYITYGKLRSVARKVFIPHQWSWQGLNLGFLPLVLHSSHHMSHRLPRPHSKHRTVSPSTSIPTPLWVDAQNNFFTSLLESHCLHLNVLIIMSSPSHLHSRLLDCSMAQNTRSHPRLTSELGRLL